jgi:DNA-binding XRE family transcriptional regulator
MGYRARTGMRHPELLADERLFYRQVGQRLREYRNTMDMPLVEAAELLKVDPDTLRHWEKGTTHPPLFQLARLAQLYAVQLIDIAA